MKIIKYKRLSNNKYILYLDNNEELQLYEDVILDNDLLLKKEIDKKDMNKILKDNSYYESYNLVYKYSLRKMRSIYEVKEYMKKNEIDNIYQDKILKKLKDLKILNDFLYTEAFISDKVLLTSYGPLKIKKELLDKQIEESIIDKYLSDYDSSIFDEKIKKIISKKNNTKYSKYLFKKKILNYLINLGYSKDMIMPYLDDIKTDDNLIKKEYTALYNKLSKKYEEPKLSYEIKNRLLRLGFTYDEINKIKE